MTEWYPFCKDIDLAGETKKDATSNRIIENRVEKTDAKRQELTARAILERLHNQPGIVLADEVGMGKTFVALAVAVSVNLADKRRRPVVVMVPSSLVEKWPRDFSYFAKRCIPENIRKKVRYRTATNGTEFLRLLDKHIPTNRRASVIFLTHGALHRALTDGWVKLAIIQHSLRYKRDADSIRRSLARCCADLLDMKWVENGGKNADIWDELLQTRPDQWFDLLNSRQISLNSRRTTTKTSEDPVPRAVIQAMASFNTNTVYKSLQKLPERKRSEEGWQLRVIEVRKALKTALDLIWQQCLTQEIDIRLPLLVMDEAHHLKNESTRLSGLFRSDDSEKDATAVSQGALAGVFERMLFLTATPFQLGHRELCSVLNRFDGIAWKEKDAPTCGRVDFEQQLKDLESKLDSAQKATQLLDSAWGELKSQDLVVNGTLTDENAWWSHIEEASAGTPDVRSQIAVDLWKKFADAKGSMRSAEKILKPFVIRHLRDRKFKGQLRREKKPGKSILDDDIRDGGIEVAGSSLLPFLLAARATACEPDKRPLFAEGLASSWNAFRHNRTDSDDDPCETHVPDVGAVTWYLKQLNQSLPTDDLEACAAHPKIEATTSRVLAAWRQGEKVLVFCHFIATGRILRRVISSKLKALTLTIADEKAGCGIKKIPALLHRFGERLSDSKSPARRAFDERIADMLQEFPALMGVQKKATEEGHEENCLDAICRRFVRTPSFLARYFALKHDTLGKEDIEQAFQHPDGSGLSLQKMIHDFFRTLEYHCDDTERTAVLTAIREIKTGEITGGSVNELFHKDELKNVDGARDQDHHFIPNVRLVNGATGSETRQRLMLTFNSPFFPEILIASSVMAEGVDLHRFCRYVIHHDLCWNPSTLEQRTGRVDRIGGKVETCGMPIQLYLPYLAETQDEKQYRVVMDRERWFSVVMGENFRTDARSTDRLAERIPLPESLAKQLAFRLELFNDSDST